MKLFIFLIAAAIWIFAPAIHAASAATIAPEFVTEMAKFPALEKEQSLIGIGPKLLFRAKQQPFLLVASIIFLLAILHTFIAVPITKHAH